MERIADSISRGKAAAFCILNRSKIRELFTTIDEVEETNIKLEFEIVTEEELKETADEYFSNKLERYKKLKKLIENFINSMLGIEETEELPFVEKVFQFRKKYIFSVRWYKIAGWKIPASFFAIF